MTDSFANYRPTSPFQDYSKLDYEVTTYSPVKDTNKQIDENNKSRAKEYARMIKEANANNSSFKKNIQTIVDFSETAGKLAQWQKEQAEMDRIFNDFTDKSKQAQLQEEEDQLTRDENEMAEQTANNYAVVNELQRSGRFPDIEMLLRAVNEGNLTRKEALNIAVNTYRKEFFEQASTTYRSPLPDGRWILYTEANNPEEEYYASKGIERVFATNLYGSGLFSRRFFNKYYIKPLTNATKLRSTTWQNEWIQSSRDDDDDKRKNELFTNLKAVSKEGKAGEAFLNFIETYHGYHGFSYKKGRDEVIEFIKEGLTSGELDAGIVDQILAHKFIPRDGRAKEVSIGEYWKAEATELKKLQVKIQKEQLQLRKDEERIQRELDENKIIDQWREQNIIPSEDDLIKANAAFKSEHGVNSQAILKYRTKQDIKDDWIVADLNRRYNRGELLDLSDLDGITDRKIREEWIEKVQQGGLDSEEVKRRNREIKSATNERTVETDATQEKTSKWNTIYHQGIDLYNATYIAERKIGTPRATALKLAKQEATKAIHDGDLDQEEFVYRDEKAANDIRKSATAVLKDPYIINSPDPLVGEEEVLKTSYKYYKTKGTEGSLPTYYKVLAKNLGKINPRLLMISRLLSTGMIKYEDLEPTDKEILKLDPANQQLLSVKPSPSRALRVFYQEINNKEGLVPITKYNTSDEAIAAARLGTERRNRFTGSNTDYLSLVNISPDLVDQYTEVVGEPPNPYMQFNTLLPAVATALVEDTLLV